MLFSFSNLVEVSLGGGSRINVCSTSLNFLNTHQPVRDCIYGSNTISVKKYICWSNITLVRYCMYLLVIYNLSHKIHLLFKYNLGQILYVFIGHIQLRSAIIFIGQIQPWSSWRDQRSIPRTSLFLWDQFFLYWSWTFFSIPKILDTKVYPWSEIAAKWEERRH